LREPTLAPRPSRLYRIVHTADATWEDFVSDEAKGKRKRGPQELDIRLYRGISMYSSRRTAHEMQERIPALGAWLAELLLPSFRYVEVHKSLGPNHYSVVGLPRVLAGMVHRVDRAALK